MDSTRPWCDPFVVRLASNTAKAGDACGLVVICSWPMPQEVCQKYEALRKSLSEVMPQEAYIYPAGVLHLTVCTLRSFHGPHMDDAGREDRRNLWTPILAAARSMPTWPKSSFRVRMLKPSFEGSAGIFRYDDSDGAVEAMRKCLLQAISDAGGTPAIGGADRSKGCQPRGGASDDPPPHLPDILHSTILRWAGEPADREAAQKAFAEAAEAWTPLEVEVFGARAVFEDMPYMHIPEDADHIWWESEPQASTQPNQRL
mmetsp:Transcript_5948/g.13085  ORF Transcript_5948/g.13085 Transcript_5948/m.13085 type:complete len:258 (+) Transcript_5948:49-822(+)